jgi:hypothetical protein
MIDGLDGFGRPAVDDDEGDERCNKGSERERE